MSLRLKLLVLALLTLVLPFAGCQYAREMESVLREGEQQSLLAVAQTIATSLQGRERLLYRDAARIEAVHAAPGDSVDASASTGTAAGPRDPLDLDLEPMPLAGDPSTTPRVPTSSMRRASAIASGWHSMTATAAPASTRPSGSSSSRPPVPAPSSPIASRPVNTAGASPSRSRGSRRRGGRPRPATGSRSASRCP
jgi:hypothetical protein